MDEKLKNCFCHARYKPEDQLADKVWRKVCARNKRIFIYKIFIFSIMILASIVVLILLVKMFLLNFVKKGSVEKGSSVMLAGTAAA